MLRLNNMDRWAIPAADASARLTPEWATSGVRTEPRVCLQITTELFTDWFWPDASDADQAIPATAGDAVSRRAARRNHASCECRTSCAASNVFSAPVSTSCGYRGFRAKALLVTVLRQTA